MITFMLLYSQMITFMLLYSQMITFVIIRGGHAQHIFESAIAILQLEESTSAIAISQLFRGCCSATPLPQFRNHNFFWSPQLQARNLRASLPQFSTYFWPWSGLKFYFFTARCFCFWEDLKGTVAQDFCPLFFFRESTPYEPLSHTLNYFRIQFQIHRDFRIQKLFPRVWYPADICLEEYDSRRICLEVYDTSQKFV
jgi:hypothetical protein